MSTSLIPESAPFTPEQRAWLNGFLAGWTGLEGLANGDANGAAPMPLIEKAAEPEEEFPWHDPNLSMDERLKLADGKPVKRQLMAAMAQLNCGACGYLCQTYSEAIADGSEKNLTLCSPGGKETSKMLKKIIKESANGEAATNGAPASNGQDATPIANDGYNRSNPFVAKLKESRNLNGPGSAKHTSHVVIDLEGSGLKYNVGDALGVYPTNCPELVDEILKFVSVEDSNGELTLFRKQLLEEYDINSVEEELVEQLISASSDTDEMDALAKLLKDDCLDDLDVLDVLIIAESTRIRTADLLECLNPLNPRLYSIASSLNAHPDEVHLTIGKVTYELGERLRKGVASTMFSDRIQVGEGVRVYLHESPDFTIPANPDTPMIMVGPGTGIAPFRAFLEERQVSGSQGKNWLFFGDQHASSDFLYQEELEGYVESGLLTRLDTAFSRDQAEKVYVQDRMMENGAELFQWLEEGAYFFVCGDARRMAVDVDRALCNVIATHGKMSEDAAHEYVSRLKDAKRYVRDVY